MPHPQTGLAARACVSAWTFEGFRFAATVVVFQANLIVVGCQNLMEQLTWLLALACCGLVSLLLLVLAHGRALCHQQCWRGNSTDLATNTEELTSPCTWVRLCAFCFATNAFPRDWVAVGQLQYAALTPTAYQTLQLVGSLSSLCASLMFAGFNRRTLNFLFIVATLVAVIVGLAQLPFSIIAAHGIGRHTLGSEIGAWALASTAFGGVAVSFMTLPIDTLVTSASGRLRRQRSSTAYAVLLSFYSFGATVGGLIAGALMLPLGLDGSTWKTLPEWIVLTALVKLSIVPLLICIPRSVRQETE